MADQEQQPERLLSLTELGKELGVSAPRLIAMHACGIITADFTSKQVILFKKERLTELRKAVTNFGLARATAANARRKG
jgi:hypothetical protein